jgi:aldose 1-epimerase
MGARDASSPRLPAAQGALSPRAAPNIAVAQARAALAHGSQPPVQILALQAGRARAAIRPDMGGALSGLWFDDLPVLRSLPPQDLSTPFESACFVTVPFAQRLGFRRMRWRGVDHTIGGPAESGAHAVHGVAWQRVWEVVSVGTRGATIRARHRANQAWPFAFEVQQTFELDESSLTMHLSLINRHDDLQPMGLGWHVALARRDDSHLRTTFAERWEADSTTRLPLRLVPCGSLDDPLQDLELDSAFEGWSGEALLRDSQLVTRMTSSLDRLAVATPRKRAHLTLCPISHAPNAIHMADPAMHGLVAVPPGASVEGWLRFDLARA